MLVALSAGPANRNVLRRRLQKPSALAHRSEPTPTPARDTGTIPAALRA